MTASTAQQAELVTQDTTQFLQRAFTGHVVSGAAMGESVLAAKVDGLGPTGVIQHGTGWLTVPTVNVELLNWIPSTTERTPKALSPVWRAFYAKPLGATPSTPPAGTACYVSFIPNDPGKNALVIAFFGWPTRQLLVTTGGHLVLK